MRENFDYVRMETYQSDMAESASHAAGIIAHMKRGRHDVERALIAAVLASGGKITVRNGDLLDAERTVLRMERNEADDTIILTTQR